MASIDADEGMDLPPQTPKDKDKYNKIGETQRRTCICGKNQCADTMRRWLVVSQHDKTYAPFVRYQYLPKDETKTLGKAYKKQSSHSGGAKH